MQYPILGFDTVARSAHMELTVLHLGVSFEIRAPEIRLCPCFSGYADILLLHSSYGFEVILTVPFLEDGPDMDFVENLSIKDAAIKGIWCVPKYANPTGTYYSLKL